jgi:hypothetical protein
VPPKRFAENVDRQLAAWETNRRLATPFHFPLELIALTWKFDGNSWTAQFGPQQGHC